MNKIVTEYLNLTHNRNINVLNYLERLTDGLDNYIIDASLFDTGSNKQFRCNLKNNICIYFNVLKRNNNDVIRAFISLKNDSYIFISEELMNSVLNCYASLLYSCEDDIKKMNGKIQEDSDTYMFNKKKSDLVIEYYSNDTLESLNKTGIMPFPDKSTVIDISDIDMFGLVNNIILNNIDLNNRYTRKRINK